MNEKEMSDLLDSLKIYWNEVKFIGESKRSIEEVRLYLKSVEVNEKQIKRHVKSLKSNEVDLFVVDSEGISLDIAKLQLLQDEINLILSRSSAAAGPCVTREDLLQVQTSKQNIQKELTDLKKQLKSQSEQIEALTQEKKNIEEKLAAGQMNHEQQLAQLVDSHAEELKKAKAMIRRLRTEKGKIPLQTHTLILSSQNIYPHDDSEERYVEAPKLREVPVAEPGKENLLSKLNYKYRITREALTEEILKMKVMRLLKKNNKEKFKTDNELLKEILGSKEYTNQQKLGLYAAFSDYRSADFVQLLNFAGECNLDADLVMMWSESLGDKLDYLQMKNSLRQFAKPSEYQLKHKLAKELLLGKWYVEYEVDGKPTVFRLISEDDVKNIRELLSLPEEAFTYSILEEEQVPAESKTVKDDKSKPSIKDRAKAISEKIKAPDFVKTMVVKKEDLDNEQGS